MHYIDDDDSGAFKMALEGQCTRFAQYSRDNYFYTGPKLLHPLDIKLSSADFCINYMWVESVR